MVVAALVVEVEVDFPGEVPVDFPEAEVFAPAVSPDQVVPEGDPRSVLGHRPRVLLVEQDHLAPIRVHPEEGRTVIRVIPPTEVIIDIIITAPGIDEGTGGMAIITDLGIIRQRIGYLGLLC